MRVDVALLPPSKSPTHETCLVVDVLRATSCMAVLLGRGAAAVYPAPSIDAARALREQLGGDALLCGEVRALPPEGFDYGNSAVEFAGPHLSLPPVPVTGRSGPPGGFEPGVRPGQSGE